MLKLNVESAVIANSCLAKVPRYDIGAGALGFAEAWLRTISEQVTLPTTITT